MMPCTYRRLEVKAEAEICWFFLGDSDGNSDLSERKRKQPCRGERGENPPLVTRTHLRNNLGKWKHHGRMLSVLLSETSKPLPRSPIGTLVQNGARSLLHIAKDRNRDALKSPNKAMKGSSRLASMCPPCLPGQPVTQNRCSTRIFKADKVPSRNRRRGSTVLPPITGD